MCTVSQLTRGKGRTGNWVSVPSFTQHNFLSCLHSLQALYHRGKVRKDSGHIDPHGQGFVKQAWLRDHSTLALWVRPPPLSGKCGFLCQPLAKPKPSGDL